MTRRFPLLHLNNFRDHRRVKRHQLEQDSGHHFRMSSGQLLEALFEFFDIFSDDFGLRVDQVRLVWHRHLEDVDRFCVLQQDDSHFSGFFLDCCQVKVVLEVVVHPVVRLGHVAEGRTHPLAPLGNLLQTRVQVDGPKLDLFSPNRSEIGDNFLDSFKIFFRSDDRPLQLDDLQHSVAQLVVAFLAGGEGLGAFLRTVERLLQLFEPKHQVGHLVHQRVCWSQRNLIKKIESIMD